MLWEVEIRCLASEVDREGERIVHESAGLGVHGIHDVTSARLFLIEADWPVETVEEAARRLLVDPVTELCSIQRIDDKSDRSAGRSGEARKIVLNVLLKPGVTDNVAQSAAQALTDAGFDAKAVATGRRYWLPVDVSDEDIAKLTRRLLANDAIERVSSGQLSMSTLLIGETYLPRLVTVPLRKMSDDELMVLSKTGQLYLSLVEMQTIQKHFADMDRDPTDIELESIAQTWSEHCSHKTLKGRIRYRDEHGEQVFENMLKETVFAATQTIRQQLGENDWCVSVFADNAGVVTFSDREHVCFKVETHNHPSAIEPYGGANTGLGGVIRDPLGTGLGARPVCNTDVFCFAPPTTQADDLPPGTLHPRVVMKGVVSGVRDYGNRMGIPTVNGAVFFDERYLGNPLVYCGTVAMLPVDRTEKQVHPGDLIVAVGGRTGRDGIHGATFSSAELTEESETISGGAVQIGNAVMEKMVHDVVLEARDRNLYHAITDCGAGGFSSAVGEMGEHTGAEVWLEKCPLKYQGLTYTEIWISEAQERMVLAVPPENWEAFRALCEAEGVEATAFGTFTGDGRLRLKYGELLVGDIPMALLHDGRPPVIRDAVFQPTPAEAVKPPSKSHYDEDVRAILGSLNVCSKEWVIRQYDHEVQAGSVVKPLVGITNDGPSDAAVVRPDLTLQRGVVVSNGMNPRLGDLDPYWMAANAIDEAVRNAVAVGADPDRIAILDNFCWGNTERPETLGSLVRAALACRDVAIAYGTPFISGKDSLNNEFSFTDEKTGERRTVAIPSSLLISAIGQIDDVRQAVTMDVKEAGHRLYLVGRTTGELGGSHWLMVNGLSGGDVPKVDVELAPKLFRALHAAIAKGTVRGCHDLSEGGLAVAAAEMAFAGGLGVRLDLEPLSRNSPALPDSVLLFAESPTRFLVEVPAARSTDFEACFQGLPVTGVGVVTPDQQLTILGRDGVPIVDSELSTLKAAWQKPLDWE